MRNDRLRARPGVTPMDAVHVDGRPGPGSLEDRPARLASGRGGNIRTGQEAGLVEAQITPLVEDSLGGIHDAVVEPGNRHGAVIAMQ